MECKPCEGATSNKNIKAADGSGNDNKSTNAHNYSCNKSWKDHIRVTEFREWSSMEVSWSIRDNGDIPQSSGDIPGVISSTFQPKEVLLLSYWPRTGGAEWKRNCSNKGECWVCSRVCKSMLHHLAPHVVDAHVECWSTTAWIHIYLTPMYGKLNEQRV